MVEQSSHSSSSSSSSSWLSNLCSSAARVKTLSPSSSASNTLIRHLTVFDLVLIGVGASIGAGIFVVTGTVAKSAGPGVTISFVIAGASCALNGLCYAECASRFPAVVGGAYLYAYTAFNELTAFLVFGQLMLDHIGAASIARSLASYLVTVIELVSFFKDKIPSWIGHGGQDFLGGALSINILAPILLILLTIVLCRGVGESSIVNAVMTTTKDMPRFEMTHDEGFMTLCLQEIERVGKYSTGRKFGKYTLEHRDLLELMFEGIEPMKND